MSLVFVDVDTQMDFVAPTGALYAPGAELLLPNWARLAAHAERAGIPVISTMDAHSEADPEFAAWPHHCIAKTLGQRKFASMLLRHGQHFVEKQTFDCFSNPGMVELLAELKPGRVCVYGVVTEVCVAKAVDGLLAREYQVNVVTDAVRAFNEDAAEQAMARWRMAGVKFLTTASLCG